MINHFWADEINNLSGNVDTYLYISSRLKINFVIDSNLIVSLLL